MSGRSAGPARGAVPHQAGIDTDREDLPSIVRRLRGDRGLTMQALARQSGLSVSTISKIENRQISPTYDTLLRVATGLGVDVADLFAAPSQTRVAGRRTITRRGEGVVHRTPQYIYEMLCGELSAKRFIPLVTTVTAHAVAEFPGLIRHEGEEFIYVLSGRVTLHTQHYAPTVLNASDSCYFDSQMGHACVSAGAEDAVVLWVCSHARALPE